MTSCNISAHMRRWLAIFLVIQANVRVKAGSLDVLPPPVGATVAQCSNLTLLWDEQVCGTFMGYI
jgi:hypothetical protein